jgi:hypothetical protein
MQIKTTSFTSKTYPLGNASHGRGRNYWMTLGTREGHGWWAPASCG